MPTALAVRPALALRAALAPPLRAFVLLAVGLLASACADDPAPEPIDGLLERLQRVEGEELDTVAEAVGKRAAEDPAVLDRLVALLRLDEPNANMITLELRLAAPDTLPDDDARRKALETAVEIMARRLTAFGYVGGTFDVRSAEHTVELQLPKPPFGSDLTQEERLRIDSAVGEALVRHLTAPGRIELLLTVPPPADGQTPPSLWTGARKAYNQMVEKQGAAIDAAVKAGTLHAPGVTGFLVCAVPPAAGQSDHGFLVTYRAPSSAEHFGRDDFSLREITFLATGEVGLELTVSPKRQAAMKAWSEANLGRRAVLVVNGVAGAPLRLAQPIDKKALIVYGPKGDRGAQARIAGVLRVAGTRPHPYAIVGSRVTAVAPDTMTPAARALVASGTAGAKKMSALRREQGSLGPRAARILELIGRRRTTGGERFVPGSD